MRKRFNQLLLVPILVILILVLVIPSILVLADSPPVFILKWGTICNFPLCDDGEFGEPWGVAVDSAGNVYVVDPSSDRLQKFDSNGNFLTKWSTSGSGVAVDSAGNVYVADNGNDRIRKFNSNGTFLTQWGSLGSSNGQFDRPNDVAVDSAGNVYVPDLFNDRIQKFDSNGNFLTKWGTSGSGDGQFADPFAIAVDSFGNVYVADNENYRIQKFDSNGTYLTKWGSKGTGDSQFADGWSAMGVAVDSAGNVYVADPGPGNHRIQKFDSNGTFLTKWGSLGSGDGQFNKPRRVAVDTAGNVYVSDNNNHRIQKFGQPSLTLVKTVSITEPIAGQLMTYTLTINNKGLINATNVLISDTLPVSTTFAGPVTLDPPQPSAIRATTAQSLPTLASNVTITAQTSITVTLPVTIDLSVTTKTLIINTAAVTSAELSIPATGRASIGGIPIYLPVILKNQ